MQPWGTHRVDVQPYRLCIADLGLSACQVHSYDHVKRTEWWKADLGND